MRLLIVSDMPHYRTAIGEVLGWGPTVQEIDRLADLFSEIQHIGFLYDGDPPPSMLPYQSGKVNFIPLKPTGGQTIADKLTILFHAPSYFATIFKYLWRADVIHVRSPSSVGLLLMVFLLFLPFPKYRWIKYAGNWYPSKFDNWSYAFQRFWLNSGLHRGLVTINGHWKNQPHHVHSFLNPSLGLAGLDTSREVTQSKNLANPVQLVFVGRVETEKGSERSLRIAKALLERGVSFHLHIIGDGPKRPSFELVSKQMRLFENVSFYGWLPQQELARFYEIGHFLLLPTSASEGWPKVLSEAMAYGVVPLAGAVSSIPQILQKYNTGMALDPLNSEAFVNAILAYLNDPVRWERESQAAREAAHYFTYEEYLEHIRAMFLEQWRVRI